MRRLEFCSAAPRAIPLLVAQRNHGLDVLRGLAILGVLIANYTEMVSYGVVATEGQLMAMPTADLDAVIDSFVAIFVTDKASATLSFLFGVGFFLFCQRLEETGATVTRIYMQRLGALLALGLAHLFLVWTWDILTVYALAGILLLLTRRMKTWMVLALALSVLAFEQQLFSGHMTTADAAWSVSQADVDYDYPVRRLQAYSQAGDYLALVRYFGQDTFATFLDGSFLSGVVHVTAFMLLGAFIGRIGILMQPSRYRKMFGRGAMLALPLGVFMEVWVYLIANGEIGSGISSGPIINEVFHISVVASTPLMAMGYMCCALYLLQNRVFSPVLQVFVPVGRMALSNYVAQSFFAGFILFGVGPGLGLAGQVGSSFMLMIGLCFFAFQIGVSHVWLRHFSHGPLEWAWRKATYAGQNPRPIDLKPAPMTA